jgi:hypothetical protein
VVEIAHQGGVQHVHVATLSKWRILLHGVPNTTGIKSVANALFPMSQEVMLIQQTATQMEQMILDCGKSTVFTGEAAMEENHLATQVLTLIVPFKSTRELETRGDHGQLMGPVDADDLSICNVYSTLIHTL